MKTLLSVAVAIALVTIGFFITTQRVDVTKRTLSKTVKAIQKTPIDSLSNSFPKKEFHRYGLNLVGKVSVDTIRIKKNQTFSDIASPLGISPETVYQLSRTSRPVFDIRKINAGRNVLAIKHTGELQSKDSMIAALVYLPNLYEYVTFEVEDSVRVWRGNTPKKITKKIVTGTINHSLSVALNNPTLTNDIVDIFAWKIDFQHLHKGDSFKIIYDEISVNGNPMGVGQVHSVWFSHVGEELYAFSFEQKKRIGYYDEEGNSLRKAFLKYPIKFTRISSRYTKSRYHPVQKRWKAHKGTDFAAPIGTPIRAVGDGVVTKSTYGKYNGNFVKIEHNGTYSTQYLHMSRRAKGIVRGKRVKQGQIIGYVGKTGLATGAHLCFRFWKNNRQVDALKVNLPSEKSVAKKDMERFKEMAKKYREELDQIPLKNATHNDEFMSSEIALLSNNK